MSNAIQKHGWTAVPRSLSTLIAGREGPKPSTPLRVDEIPLPNTLLVQEVLCYAKERLSPQTFNHSMRVYYFGQAVLSQHFPSWSFSPETLLLTSLLHDIGTTPSNRANSYLSFEFQGGMVSHTVLTRLSAPSPQAEAVCETIIRHQDLGETGNITALTAMIHFATVLDNAGLNAELVHAETIKNVVEKFPRNGWTGCFADVVRKECESKPWANTTRIEGFAEMVEGNELMRAYD